MEYIYHYTSINTLELILRNKTIRFNRLDKVDDLREHKSLEKYKLDKYVFVSCWTEESIESIPLWTMYSDGMKGVRLSFPKEVFFYKPLIASSEWVGTFIEEGTRAPIRFEEFFGDDYLIFPFITNRNNFYKKVIYVNDLENHYKNIVDQIIDPHTGKINVNMRLGEIAYFKDVEWTFQNESRFILIIFPAMKLPKGGFINDTISEQYTNYHLESVLIGRPAPFDHYDINIEKSILENIQIMMGPKTNKEDYRKVENILNAYSINTKPVLSILHDRIAT